MMRCALALLLAGGLAGPVAAQDTPPAARPAPMSDGTFDGMGRGAAIGALATLPLALAQMASCDTGCDWSSTPALLLGWSMLGAAAGTAVGLAADLDAPSPLSARVGVAYSSTSLRSSALTGRAATPAFVAAVQLSRHISVHTEFVRVSARFPAAPGAVPDEVLQNIVREVPDSRPAGFARGIESRRVDYVFTELVGIHPAPWGRVRLELLGGLAVQGEEERDYYDAYRQVAPGRTEPLRGKYYVLDFESPDIGLVIGVDAEIAIARGLSVVPTVRYRAMESSSSSVSYGAGLHWRF